MRHNKNLFLTKGKSKMFKNTQMKIKQFMNHFEPELMPMVAEGFKNRAKFNTQGFKQILYGLAMTSILIAMLAKIVNFDSWPILSSIMVFILFQLVLLQIVLLYSCILDFMNGQMELRIFLKEYDNAYPHNQNQQRRF
ncbi:MAG: hypothetical protein JNM24_02890 [Bdellovibrionaceae bacterium]|nr:hypothetical protein [Pseudobdellovibrionaceae bacterium]